MSLFSSFYFRSRCHSELVQSAAEIWLDWKKNNVPRLHRSVSSQTKEILLSKLCPFSLFILPIPCLSIFFRYLCKKLKITIFLHIVCGCPLILLSPCSEVCTLLSLSSGCTRQTVKMQTRHWLGIIYLTLLLLVIDLSLMTELSIFFFSVPQLGGIQASFGVATLGKS